MFFLLAFSNLQKSTRTSFWEPEYPKRLPKPSRNGPPGTSKTIFSRIPGILHFDATLSYNCCFCLSRCFKFVSRRCKKTTGDVLSAKTVPTLLFCNFFQKMSQNGFPEGVPGRVREPLFRNLFQSCLLRGLPGGPGSVKCSPRVSKRGPGTAKTKPRGCQNAPGCAIGRITF